MDSNLEIAIKRIRELSKQNERQKQDLAEKELVIASLKGQLANKQLDPTYYVG